MSRWNLDYKSTAIERAGSGIEKSGSGIEKSGSGIEKSGSGIEKSGSGIEKSGSGIRALLTSMAFSIATLSGNAFGSSDTHPAGSMQIVVNQETVAVSWIIDGSVFSGVSKLNSSFANLELTEIGLLNENESLQVAGGGTGREVAGGGTGKEVAGGGTGKEVAGGGTGKEVAGGGTGILVAGGGTGILVAGGGTGILVAGGGTGVAVAGGGTGSDASTSGTGRKYWADGDETLLIAGGGTGSDAIQITLPGGTDMQMEVSLGCNSANVTIFDANFVEVVAFNGVPAIGASSYCNSDRADYPLLARNFDIPGDFERDR